jgi:hypothetical protein
MVTISWTDHVRNVEILHTVKEGRTTLHTSTIKRKKANCTVTSCEETAFQSMSVKERWRWKVTGRRRRRRKQLLDDFKEKGKYWKQRGNTTSQSVENSL